MSKPASSITFLYFENLPQAKDFFTSVLGLEQSADQGWAMIWRTGATGFLGAVDARKGSIPVTARGGVLISLNVDDVEVWHRRMKQAGVRELTAIKYNPDIGLRSFFFKGPEGYDFEIQEFVRPEDREVFLPRAVSESRG